MKKLFLASLVLCAAAVNAFAQGAPATVSFAARLQDNGLPLMGAHDFTFALFDAPTGGTQKYIQTNNQQMVGAEGLLYLDLGPFSATTHFSGPALYLEITIDGAVTTPRILIESVPYALRSGKASDADGMAGVAAIGWQKAVTNACSGATDTIKSINQDGTVTCYTGQVYTAASGGGLLLSSNMFSVDPTVYQQRIKACATGAISAVAQDGTPTCVNVPTAAGTGIDATQFATGTVAVDFTVAQKRIASTCSVGQAIIQINQDGSIVCDGPYSPQFTNNSGTVSTNSTSYVTGAGPSATVAAPPSGRVLVTMTANIGSTGGQQSLMGFSIDGGGPANDAQTLVIGGGGTLQASASYVVSVTASTSHTFAAVYRVTGGGSVTFANRSIIVTPLP